MKKKLLFRSILMAVSVSLLATGCVVRYAGPAPVAEVEVGSEPPPPVVESVTLAPAPGFVWIGGAWIWRGGWVWEPGHWSRPPHAGMIWVQPRYVYRGGHRMWVRGYWR